jgi:hypothetical protein
MAEDTKVQSWILARMNWSACWSRGTVCIPTCLPTSSLRIVTRTNIGRKQWMDGWINGRGGIGWITGSGLCFPYALDSLFFSWPGPSLPLVACLLLSWFALASLTLALNTPFTFPLFLFLSRTAPFSILFQLLLHSLPSNCSKHKQASGTTWWKRQRRAT